MTMNKIRLNESNNLTNEQVMERNVIKCPYCGFLIRFYKGWVGMLHQCENSNCSKKFLLYTSVEDLNDIKELANLQILKHDTSCEIYNQIITNDDYEDILKTSNIIKEQRSYNKIGGIIGDYDYYYIIIDHNNKYKIIFKEKRGEVIKYSNAELTIEQFKSLT